MTRNHSPPGLLTPPWQLDAFCKRLPKARRSRRMSRPRSVHPGDYQTGAMDAFKFSRTYLSRCEQVNGRIMFSFRPNGYAMTKADRQEMNEVVKFLTTCAAARANRPLTPPKED